jgi:hypothetical protein
MDRRLDAFYGLAALGYILILLFDKLHLLELGWHPDGRLFCIHIEIEEIGIMWSA